MVVTGMAAGIAGHCLQPFAVGAVALVVLQGPGPIESGGSEVFWAPGDGVALAVADAAANAFDPGFNLPASRRVWVNGGEAGFRHGTGDESPPCLLPFFEEWPHVADQITQAG